MLKALNTLALLTCSLTYSYAISGDSDYDGHNYCNYTVESNDYNCTDDSSCPTWFRCDTGSNRCRCGEDYHKMIMCDKKSGRAAVSSCHCVTYDHETMETVVGSCYYNCENTVHEKLYDKIYHRLPPNPRDLNHFMCDRFNRTGTLCGTCANGTSPFVLSYNLSCVECPDGHLNWWKFIIAGFVPLTFFYFFMVLFNINITSSRLHGVVLFSQGMSMPALSRIVLLTFQTKPDMLDMVKAILPFYSFWNLDFFRSTMPDICINLSTLEALALDYVTAVYPILLMTLSYILIVLYDKNVGCVVCVWRPFKKLFSLFKKNWDVRTSVIDSFATFFLLSYVKIISVSGDLLMFTYVYGLDDKKSARLFYDPSLVYFGKEHLPYAVLAIFFLSFFVVLPTVILTLYPLQLFQKFLSCFPVQWHFLRTFVDSFQGCYKDGTEEGTLDCRFFAQYDLFMRFAFFTLYALTRSSMFFVYAAIVCTVFIIIFTNVNVFKKMAIYYPSMDLTFMIMLALLYVSIIGVNIASIIGHNYLPILLILVMVSPFLTFLYILYIIFEWLISQRKCCRRTFRAARYRSLFLNSLSFSQSLTSSTNNS